MSIQRIETVSCSPCSEAERHFGECGELVSRAVCTEASESVTLLTVTPPIAGTQASLVSAGIEFGAVLSSRRVVWGHG